MLEIQHLILKAPIAITTAADDNFLTSFPIFETLRNDIS